MIDITKIMENMIILAKADIEGGALNDDNTICGECNLRDEIKCTECILGVEPEQLDEIEPYIEQLKLMETLNE